MPKNKTNWKPLSEITENNIEYWLLDQNNVVGFGHLEECRWIIYNLEKTPANFDKPVMFAEMRSQQPPEVPAKNA
jgi:hypothetical protein